VTSPANNTAFGPGQQTCNAGTDKFGVLVQATADQQANRTAQVSVNGTVVATGLTIASNGTFSACVAVPDDGATSSGSSTITISVGSTLGSGHDDVTRTVSVHTIITTAPADSGVLVSTDNCASSGFGYNVVVSVDASLDGQMYTLSSGAGTLMGTVSGSQISGCVPLAEGPNTITASINGSQVMNAVHVTVDNLPPSHAIVIDTPTFAPASAAYRSGSPMTWPTPVQDWPGQLVAYQLRCASTAVVSGSESAWWNSAKPVAMPGSPTPPSTTLSGPLPLRPEEPSHCVLRAADSVGQLTPISQSTDLTLKLRQVVMFAASTAIQFGASVAGLGDVDGDNVDDFLVGSRGRAQLFFGVGSTGSPGDPSTAQSVVFTGSGTGPGRTVAGIGDFNNDGLNDFAIDDPLWNASAGRVSVYFGRPKAQWPATVTNLDDTSSCQADLCLNGPALGSLGRAIAAVGDFDADGVGDMAIGSQFYPNYPTTDGQLLVVLGGKYEARSCSSNADCRATETCQGSACQLAGGRTFWQMQFALPSGNWTDTPSGTPAAMLNGFQLDSGGSLTSLGTSIAALGLFDNVAGADLAVSAPNLGEILYLSGRTHSGQTGFDLLHASDLGLRNVTTHVPSGTPLATGSTADLYGLVIAAVGDLFTAPTGTTAAPDLAICGSLVDYMQVRAGDPTSASDPGFSTAAINIPGDASYIGQSVASAEHPALGLPGDIDGDGQADLLAGTTYSKDAVLFYHDTFAARVADNNLHKTTGIAIRLQAETPNTANLNVQYVGDFNKDGHMDIVIGDYRAAPSSGSTFRGQAILLY
jgi:hypothetical protein